MSATASSSLHSSGRRNYGLDVLRTWAVLMVLLAHGSAFFFAHLPQHRRLLDVLGWLGFIGVELFFALSGFLIGGILLRTGAELKHLSGMYGFWRKRWYRTLPNYYVYLLLHIVFLYALADFGSAVAEQWRYFFFVQGFAWMHPGFFAEAWSLAIEEWFYLLTPVALALLLRLGASVRVAFLVVSAVFILAPVTLRWLISTWYPDIGLDVHRKTVILRLDGIMYGVLAAMLLHYLPTAFRKFRFALLALALLIFYGMFDQQFSGHIDITRSRLFNTGFLAGAPLAGAALIPFFFYLREFFQPAVRFHYLTARLSYSLYLCNLLVLGYMVRHINPTAPLDGRGALMMLSFFILVCYGVAHLSYQWIEKPGLALRDRLPRKRAAQRAHAVDNPVQAASNG